MLFFLKHFIKKDVFSITVFINHQNPCMFQKDIIEKCRRNDRKAQLQLYNNYCDGMYSVAKRYLRHDAEAEDAVQDAFIKAFTKMHLFSGDVAFGAWLKKIVIRTCLDVLKKRKMNLVDLDSIQLKEPISDEESHWVFSNSISLDHIKNAIDKVSQNYKLVLNLYLIEGYDHQEISGILNINEATSRTYLHRGKQKLQQQLNLIGYEHKS